MSFSAAGKTSITRSMVLAAEVVCRVPNTRCPVSAAVSARRMVSRSRISPTRMMSGSSRRAERKASEKPRVSLCTSRWLTRQRFDSCTNSMGSSMVRIWSYRLSLIKSTIAARVVDLPEPVGPVTNTRPLGSREISLNTSPMPRSSMVQTLEGMVRKTPPAPRFWLKALTRKRATPGTSKEKSVSRNSSKSLRWRSFMMSYIRSCTWACSRGATLILRTSPSTLIIGGSPADRCRSEAPCFALNASSSVISIISLPGDTLPARIYRAIMAVWEQ